MVKVVFTTDIEREEILDLYVNIKGYVWKGEENTDNNYLLFDTPTPYHILNEEGKLYVDIDTWLLEEPGLPDGIDTSVSDEDLNTFISDYYFNSVDVTSWRVSRYALLRKISYPDSSDKFDAEVKINSGIPSLEEEGQQQLADYVEACLNVKVRFPKG